MTEAEEIRKEYNRYQREWRAKNKARVKEINARYWKKRMEKRKEAEHETENS